MTRTSDRTSTRTAPCDGNELGEELTFQGPGWTIEAAHYDVICWAPGQVLDNGRPTGDHRDKWMLWVEVGDRPAPTSDAHPDQRPSSGFAAGASLGDVLPALALLPDADRSRVIEALFRNLGEIGR